MGENNEEILENNDEIFIDPAMIMPEEMIVPKSEEEMIEDYLRNLERNKTTFYGTIEELAEEIMIPFPAVNDILDRWEMDLTIERHINHIEGQEGKQVIFFKK